MTAEELGCCALIDLDLAVDIEMHGLPSAPPPSADTRSPVVTYEDAAWFAFGLRPARADMPV